MTITKRLTRLKAGLATAVLLAAGAAVAQAATPESGTVSPDNPKVTWEGTLTSSGVHQLLWEDDPDVPCPQPICDSFALTVDGGEQDLTIGLNIQDLSATDSEPNGGIKLTKPDGSVQYITGTSGPETTLRMRVRGADPGDYEVEVNASYICCGDTPYIAFAEVPGAEPAPSEPRAGDPPPTGGDEDAAPQLTISAPKKLSARRIKKSRKLPVTIESTGPVSDVRATLLKGRRKIATAKLASLDGSRKVKLKASKKAARKIKKGTYSLNVAGKDGQGRTVGSAIKVRLRR